MPTDASTRRRLVSAIRERIFADLGNECAVAGDHEEECSGPLTVDHPNGRSYVPRRLSFYNRWLKYAKEHERGEIRLLCSHHNNILRPRPLAYDPATQPF